VGCDDDTLPDYYGLVKFYDILRGPCSAGYRWNLDFSPRLPEVLEELGYVNVQQQRRKLPIGGWPKDVAEREVGMHFAGILFEFVEAILLKHEDVNLTEHEASQLREEIKRSFYDPTIHAYVGWISVWGQRAATTNQVD